MPAQDRHASGGWHPFMKSWTPASAGETFLSWGDVAHFVIPAKAGI